ncbi:hypothetical protein ABPG72_022829 [Tetrahymena utriculariae]
MNQKISSVNVPLEDLDFFNIEGFRHDGFLGCSNAPVYRYVDINQSDNILAFKELKIKDDEDYKRVVSNFKTLQRIKINKHPNIIQILGFCKSIKQKVYGEDISAYLIMEHCEGNLDDYIQMMKKSGNQFTLTEIKKFFSQTISALEFLQSYLKIAHRDIKPENILVDKTNFKIADLDDSKIDLNKTMEKSLVLGTLSFMAPELLKAYNRMKDRLSYNAYKSDVYSLGLCLLYMCTFKKFSKDERLNGVINKTAYQKQVKQLRSQVKERYGNDLSKLIKMMLEIDPALRPDFSTLKKIAIDKAFLEESDFFQTNNNQAQMRQQISIDLNSLARKKQHCILSDSEGTTAHYSSDNQDTSEGSQRQKEYFMNIQNGNYHRYPIQQYQQQGDRCNNLQSNLPRNTMQKQNSNPNQRELCLTPEKPKSLSISHAPIRSNLSQQYQNQNIRNILNMDPSYSYSAHSLVNQRQSPPQAFSFDQQRNSYLQGKTYHLEQTIGGFCQQNNTNQMGNMLQVNFNFQGQGSIQNQAQANLNQNIRKVASNITNNQCQKIGSAYIGTMPEPILEYNSMKHLDERSNTDRTESNQSNCYYQQDSARKHKNQTNQSGQVSRTNSQVSYINNKTNSQQDNSVYPESQISNSVIAERQNTFTVSEIIRENQNIKQQQLNKHQDEDQYIDDGSRRDYIDNFECQEHQKQEYYVHDQAEKSSGKRATNKQKYLASTEYFSDSSSQQHNEFNQNQKNQTKDINIYDDTNQATCISQKKKRQNCNENMVKIVEDDSNFFDTFIDSQSQIPNQNTIIPQQPEIHRRNYHQFQNPDQIRRLSQQRKTLAIVIVIMILFTIALGLFYIIQSNQSSAGSSNSTSDNNDPDTDPKTYTVEECKQQKKMYLAGKCYAKCPQQNYYPDTDQMICVQCDPSCLECTWGEANSCKKCKQDLYLLSLNQQTGMCVSDCPNYFRKDNTINKCMKCPENCITCSSLPNKPLLETITSTAQQYVVCQKCSIEYYLLGDNLCVNVCPKDTITDSQNRKCVVQTRIF